MAKTRRKKKKYTVKFDDQCPEDLQEWLLTRSGPVTIDAHLEAESRHCLLVLEVEELI